MYTCCSVAGTVYSHSHSHSHSDMRLFPGSCRLKSNRIESNRPEQQRHSQMSIERAALSRFHFVQGATSKACANVSDSSRGNLGRCDERVYPRLSTMLVGAEMSITPCLLPGDGNGQSSMQPHPLNLSTLTWAVHNTATVTAPVTAPQTNPETSHKHQFYATRRVKGAHDADPTRATSRSEVTCLPFPILALGTIPQDSFPFGAS